MHDQLLVHPLHPLHPLSPSVLDAGSWALTPVQSADPSTSLGMTAGADPSLFVRMNQRPVLSA